MSEHEDQCALFQWLSMQQAACPELGLAFAIPNGTRTTPQVSKKMVAEGVKKGVPDICLPVARGNYHALYIEMKSPGACPRPEQRAWLKALAERGNYTTVCHSWTEAAAVIIDYLEGRL